VRIRLLDQAVEEVKALRAYIAQHDPSAAVATGQRIRDATKILGDYPAAGRAGRVPNTRELLVSGTPYILPYRVRAETIEILRVFHVAQQWPEN
jgi:toxin ParE1/3/4